MKTEIQSAIELLNTLLGEWQELNLLHCIRKFSDSVKTAISALELQQPKPVIHKKTLAGDYVCPNCNAAFIDGMDTTPYCGNCGQKLEWPEVECD